MGADAGRQHSSGTVSLREQPGFGAMIPEYAVLKAVHVSCAAASYALFVVRGIWMMRDSTALRARWVRIVHHVIDTVLLASAIAMAVMTHQYPLANRWVTAKVAGLLVYIGLGTIALKRGKTCD